MLIVAATIASSVGCTDGRDGDDPAAPSTSLPAASTTTVGSGDRSETGEGAPLGASLPASSGATSWWRPTPGASFAWQLRGRIDPDRIDAEVVDVDGFDTPAATVDRIHERGGHAVCYVSVGSFEDWRPDAASFPDEVLGAPLDGWEGERWLDVRRLDALEPIMARRMDRCRERGFDAVEADNVDGFQDDSGFALSGSDQLVFNRRMAAMAHDRGMSFALKNDLAQIPELVDAVDFAVVEQCAEFDECDRLDPFVRAGKAVFAVEYEACPPEVPTGFTMLRLPLELDGSSRQTC